jgi:hypothetical protein
MNADDRETIEAFETILRRLQREGPPQFVVEVETSGGTHPEPRFKIINIGELGLLMPSATEENGSLADVLDDAFEMWSES